MTKEQLLKLIKCGDTMITVQSGKTGIYFTYRIQRTKQMCAYDIQLVLRKRENGFAYRYIGTYYIDTDVYIPPQRYVFDVPRTSWPPSLIAIHYMFNNVERQPKGLYVFECIPCKFCGKMLTTPQSIITGAGPECTRTNLIHKLEYGDNDEIINLSAR